MINIMKKNIPILLIFLILGSYLGIKALDKTGWDGWGFGSAPVLMTVKYWNRDGWIKHYLLYTPQGYSKTVAKYLDEPELRHLTPAGRFYYTHYPPGFIFPFALLGELGFEQRFWFRWLAIIISLGGLILFYKFICLIVNKTAAFWGTVFYGFSTTFLDFADSIATQPIEDLLKYGIIFASVLALKKGKNYKYLLWLLYFFLSISTYDSTFFIFTWLIGLDILIRKAWAFKKWLFFASAPILAFTLQVIQNAWYLGWHNVISDFQGAYIRRSAMGSFIDYTHALYAPLKWFLAPTAPLNNWLLSPNIKWLIAISVVTLLATGIFVLFKKNSEFLKDVAKISMLLYLSSIVQQIFIPANIMWSYGGRFIALLIGLFVGVLMVLASKYLIIMYNSKQLRPYLMPFAITVLILIFLWSLEIKNTVEYLKQWPNHAVNAATIDFSDRMKLQIPGDKIGFYLSDSNTVAGNPPPNYTLVDMASQYYFDMPILSFSNAGALINDLVYLKNRSQFPFSPVIMAENEKTALDLQEKIDRNSLLKTKIKDSRVLVIDLPLLWP